MRSEKRISRPTARERSNSSKTPLADTFLVRAGNSPSLENKTTGNVSGNRTAHRTSCRATTGADGAVSPGNPEFETLIGCYLDSELMP
jgi:DNA topoisomerase IB